eukprot:m.132315 g.132315  ORF g.132315 m.132315 type:complete len:1165 (+) comp9483_c0_seq13:100-3594(+)
MMMVGSCSLLLLLLLLMVVLGLPLNAASAEITGIASHSLCLEARETLAQVQVNLEECHQTTPFSSNQQPMASVTPIIQLIQHVCPPLVPKEKQPTPPTSRTSDINAFDDDSLDKRMRREENTNNNNNNNNISAIVFECFVSAMIKNGDRGCAIIEDDSSKSQIQINLDRRAPFGSANVGAVLEKITREHADIVELVVRLRLPRWGVDLHDLLTSASWNDRVSTLRVLGEAGGGAILDHTFSTFSNLTHIRFNLNNARLWMQDNAFANLENKLGILDVADNYIEPFNWNSITGLLAMTDIRMQRSGLRAIPPHAFRGLSSLRNIWVHQNSITSLSAVSFHGLTQLHSITLFQNMITTLPPGVFDGLEMLGFLYLYTNHISIIPEKIFDDLTGLMELFLDNNEIERLPEMVFASTTRLRILRLHQNRLLEFPRIDDLTSLFDVSFANNPNLEISFGQLSILPNLRNIAISNIKAFDVSSSSLTPANENSSDASLIKTWKRLDTVGTPYKGNIAQFLTQFSSQFDLFSIGWNELNGDVLPIDAICSVFIPRAISLTISYTAYTSIDVCLDKIVDSVRLNNNFLLESVTGSVHNLMDVSSNDRLSSLSTESVEILDISNTYVPFSPTYCRISALFARHMLNPLFALDAQRSFSLCFQSDIGIFDFSENGWINDLSRVDDEAPTRVVLGKSLVMDDYFTDTRLIANFRSSVPVVLLEGAPIQCGVVFELVDLALSERTLPAFTFHCDCSQGFRRKGRVCVSVALSSGEIAGITVGSIVLVMLLTSPFLYKWYLKKKREKYELLQEKELSEHLLGQEVEALKKGWQIDLNELELVVKVDEGAFGEVWKAQWDGVSVAVKFLKYASMGLIDKFMLNDFDKELDFLRRTRHPHLVRFFGTGIDNHGAPFLVLEFVDLGSLKHILFERGLDVVLKKYKHDRRSESEMKREVGIAGVESVEDLKWSLVEDVAKGMAFLHGLDVMHRDLKSGNVLVTKRLVAKITDFGSMSGKLRKNTGGRVLGQRADSAGEVIINETELLEYDNKSTSRTVGVSATMTNGVGTPLYMAPEVLDGKNRHLSLKADVFSFGVLMWEVWECKVPDLIEQELGNDFRGFLLTTLFRLYEDGKLLQFPKKSVPSEYSELANACMSFNAAHRPSFEVILERLNEAKHGGC